MIAAAVVLGLLTTGFGTGFFSKADAQTPTTPVAAKVPPKMFWEYKLVPQDKDFTEKEFLAFLNDMEAKGSWEYAGTQMIRVVPDPKMAAKTPIVPYMVFKRRIAIVAAGDGELRLGLEALADAYAAQKLKAAQEVELRERQRDYLNKMNKALADALRVEADAARADADAAAKADAAKADARKREDERAHALAKAKLAIQQAEAEVLVVQAELERAMALVQGATEKLNVLERQYAKGFTPQETVLNAKRDVIEAEKNAKVIEARLEVARAARNRVRADLEQALPPAKADAGSGGTPKPVLPPAIPGTPPAAVTPPIPKKDVASPDQENVVLRLKHIDATSAAKVVRELTTNIPLVKSSKLNIVAEVHTNSLFLSGNKEAVEQIRKIVDILDSEAPKK